MPQVWVQVQGDILQTETKLASVTSVEPGEKSTDLESTGPDFKS